MGDNYRHSSGTRTWEIFIILNVCSETSSAFLTFFKGNPLETSLKSSYFITEWPLPSSSLCPPHYSLKMQRLRKKNQLNHVHILLLCLKLIVDAIKTSHKRKSILAIILYAQLINNVHYEIEFKGVTSANGKEPQSPQSDNLWQSG